MGLARTKLFARMGMKYVAIYEGNHPVVRRLVAFLITHKVKKSALNKTLDWYTEADKGPPTSEHIYFPRTF
jgi:hypothetical protein